MSSFVIVIIQHYPLQVSWSVVGSWLHFSTTLAIHSILYLINWIVPPSIYTYGKKMNLLFVTSVYLFRFVLPIEQMLQNILYLLTLTLMLYFPSSSKSIPLHSLKLWKPIREFIRASFETSQQFSDWSM